MSLDRHEQHYHKIPFVTNMHLTTKVLAFLVLVERRAFDIHQHNLRLPDHARTYAVLTVYYPSSISSGWGHKYYDTTTYVWQHDVTTKHQGWILRKNGWQWDQSVTVTVWVDGGHASCSDTRRSRGGYLLFLNGDLTDFGSKLHPGAPDQSSTVAEYRTVTDTCNTVIWLCSCLNEMGITIREPIIFHKDNETCINRATNFMTTKHTKHVDISHHVIRYWCRRGVMDFAYMPTNGQLTDMMTKYLLKPATFQMHVRHTS